MTGKELIKYIEIWGLEDCPIEVQYRDDGGCYYGTDHDIEPTIIKRGISSSCWKAIGNWIASITLGPGN